MAHDHRFGVESDKMCRIRHQNGDHERFGGPNLVTLALRLPPGRCQRALIRPEGPLIVLRAIGSASPARLTVATQRLSTAARILLHIAALTVKLPGERSVVMTSGRRPLSPSVFSG